MSAFHKGREVESQGVAMIIPLLRRWAGTGRVFDHRDADREFQKKHGDFLIIKKGRRVTIEFKTEVKNKHNNFFFETMSNFTEGRETPGWIAGCEVDIVLYLFLASRELYSINWPLTKKWLAKNIENYERKSQTKYKQLNNTVGRPVPIRELVRLGLARRETL